MKYDFTKKFEEACYSEEEFTHFGNMAYWGEDYPCAIILGADVPENIKEKYHLTLVPTCGYIFHMYLWNGTKECLKVHRMTMHPKTAANIARGSRKYGFDHISATC